jgi:hypothetical protein
MLNRKLIFSAKYAVKPSIPIASLIDIKVRSMKNQRALMGKAKSGFVASDLYGGNSRA